jgi:hypothetical protein
VNIHWFPAISANQAAFYRSFSDLKWTDSGLWACTNNPAFITFHLELIDFAHGKHYR